eukprot:351171-Chlamydomonas_euryale.AAC.1
MGVCMRRQGRGADVWAARRAGRGCRASCAGSGQAKNTLRMPSRVLATLASRGFCETYSRGASVRRTHEGSCKESFSKGISGNKARQVYVRRFAQ